MKRESQINSFTPVFIAALFTIARSWKQPKYLPINELKNKIWTIQKMEYYSAIRNCPNT